jgi:hypothetical protein
MIYTIKKGRHYAFPLSFSLKLGTKYIKKTVIFSDSCLYDLKSTDQLDWNKLFGIGYFPSHHRNSIRFVWRAVGDKIEIAAYMYHNKILKIIYMYKVTPGLPYDFSIRINQKGYILSVGSKTIAVSANNKKFFGYYLRPYFGGNQKAPHDMDIIIK